MISSAWERSTEFVVRVLFVTVDYEEAFQLILTMVEHLHGVQRIQLCKGSL